MKRASLTVLTILAILTSSTANAATNPAVVVELAKSAGISEELAKRQIEQVVQALKNEMIAGRDVSITNFGKFYVQERAARVARNPKTGAPLNIDPKRYPRFTSADKFKDEMNPGHAPKALLGPIATPQTKR